MFDMMYKVLTNDTYDLPAFLKERIDGMNNAEQYKYIYDTYGGDPRGNYGGFKGLLYLYAPTMRLCDDHENVDPYIAIFGPKPPSKAELKRAIDIMMEEK